MAQSLIELEPKPADDYEHRYDLFVGLTVSTDLWFAAHSNTLFFCERFSRCGETFCFLKLDGSEGLDEEKFADKSEIEDALDAALQPDGIGGCIGGGTGLRYSYIDLSLTDVDRGIEIIRKVLQQGNISKRSWILFFEADMVGEWIGIYDDTPAPP